MKTKFCLVTIVLLGGMLSFPVHAGLLASFGGNYSGSYAEKLAVTKQHKGSQTYQIFLKGKGAVVTILEKSEPGYRAAIRLLPGGRMSMYPVLPDSFMNRAKGTWRQTGQRIILKLHLVGLRPESDIKGVLERTGNGLSVSLDMTWGSGDYGAYNFNGTNE